MRYPVDTELPDGIVKCNLKPHNIKAYNEAREQIELYGRCAIVQPTGTGKSYVMMKIMQDFYDRHKIILGPSKGAMQELEYKPEWVESNTLVYTYSNAHNLISLFRDYDVKDVGLIVLDELHRVGASVWGTNVKRLIEMYPDAAILGLTATPIRFLDSKRDMVSELFNGISAGNLTLQQCIEQGILPTPTYVTAMFDIDSDIRNRLIKIDKRSKSKSKAGVISEVNAKEAERLIDEYKESWKRDETIVSILRKHIGDSRDKNYKHIVFVPTIELANEMRTVIKGWFERIYTDRVINVYVVHSGNIYKEVELDGFCEDKQVGSIDILIAVNMANEGFHIKNTKSIIMLRYTQSPNVYLQQIGRALASGGESPIIFDLIGNIDAVGNVTEFLNSMEVKVSNVLKDNVHEIIKHKASKLFRVYEDNTSDFRKVLNTVDRLVSNKWDTNIFALKDLIASDIISSFDRIQDIELKKWAKEQQKLFLNGTLTTEKTEQFRGLGKIAYMTSTLQVYGSYWLDTVDLLKAGEYVKESDELALKFRLYCNRLPMELIAYIKDRELDLDLNETWFKKTCERYNKQTTDRFYEILHTIFNDSRVRLYSECFNTEVYMNTIESVLKLKKLFFKYKDREDSAKAILINLFSRYWKIHGSEIASKIETDEGTLEIHLELCKAVVEPSKELIESIKNDVISIERGLRATSTNILISIIKEDLEKILGCSME